MIALGAVVTRGRGKTQYRVVEFWTATDGTAMASLEPLAGYTSASAPVASLREVAA